MIVGSRHKSKGEFFAKTRFKATFEDKILEYMTNLRNIKRSALLTVALLLCQWSAYGTPDNQRESILIISSYNPDTRRMSSFINDFEQQITKSAIPCEIFIETLECRGVDDAPKWMSQIDNMLHRYELKKLRAVVLLGQEAWASFVSLGRFPDGVMVYGCFISSNGIMLPPPENPNATWQPQSIDYIDLNDSINNIGGVVNNYDIDSNIKLILSIYPEVENIAFVSDNTYGGISLQALARKSFTRYPNINLILIDSRAGDSICREEYASLPSKSAVMLGTWRVGSDGEYLMQRSLNEMVQTNPNTPVFSLTRTGIGDVAIGGYVPRYGDGANTIAEQISEYYATGKPSTSHFTIAENEYVFDSKKLKEWKIAEYSLPRGSLIEDAIATKLSKYSYYIDLLAIAIGLLILLLGFVCWLFLHTRNLKRMLEIRGSELIEARRRAEESDMLKSAFLANMSHEIRTPLNAIVGFSSLMQSEEFDQEERSEYCSVVVNNSEMLLTLLNDILDISSLECGKIKFSFSSEDVVQLCQHIMMTTAHTRAPGVEGRFECNLGSYMLYTDAHRLSQILINLLTNASKFTSEGAITLAMELHEEQNAVLFSVTDTGHGIPLDKQEQVFNRFEKLEGNKKKGTGLGLAICRQIAMIFGGEIWVDPAYTDGARFVFLHPIQIMNKEHGINHDGGGYLEQ